MIGVLMSLLSYSYGKEVILFSKSLFWFLQKGIQRLYVVAPRPVVPLSDSSGLQ